MGNLTVEKSPHDPYAPFRVKEPLDHQKLPSPIFDENPGYLELYWKAWDLAWSHVLRQKEAPQPFYIDEAMDPWTIWIWDTCFMVLFCRYAPFVFPGIESLNNFYFILHDHVKTRLRIHFADNPPLFPWVEWEYYQITGDRERLEWILHEKAFLQKHFEFIESSRPGKRISGVGCSLYVKKYPLGYRWRGNTSGMDNSPRGRNWLNNTKFNSRGQLMWNFVLWVDLLAQQALAANYISSISAEIGDNALGSTYQAIYNEKIGILNAYYWDPVDGFYYDIKNRNKATLDLWKSASRQRLYNKVQTLASYWPMLCGACDAEQAASLAQFANDPAVFGGDIPWPSLARNDPEYDPRGRYWRGGVWLPTAYMATKALERYGYFEIADNNAQKLLNSMWRTYHDFTPHTIWECYSPSEFKPSTQKRNERFVKEYFCGWSALGPISMLIENVLGFHRISAPENLIEWRITHTTRHGIRNLRFGSTVADLVYEKGQITIQSSKAFLLKIVGRENEIQEFQIQTGSNTLKI